jgi:hypothetical protein
MASLVVRLKRDAATPGPEYSTSIWSWVDPMTGAYREIVPEGPRCRLALAVGETRPLSVDLSELRWFYQYLGNRTPERLSDVAPSGCYKLEASLELHFASAVRIVRVGPYPVTLRSE